MFKAYRNLLPIPCQSLFRKNDDIHDHNTRQRIDFHPPKPKTNLFKRTIAYRGVIIWKLVRNNIDVDCSYVCFKCRVKKMYLNLQ